MEHSMCNSVRYQDREYQTPTQLAELVGGEVHIAWLAGRPHDMSGCLCPVDLEETLQQAGFHWRRGVDPMEWTAFKSSGAA
jgi:hypothetical protein